MITELRIDFDNGLFYVARLVKVEFMQPNYRIMLENTGEVCPNLVFFEEILGIIRTHHDVSRWENLSYS